MRNLGLNKVASHLQQFTITCMAWALIAMPAIAQPTDSTGVVVNAHRITESINLDGRLDEDVYRNITPITRLIQQLPNAGEPATERTEAWVMFDDTNIYISCRCWTEQADRIVANDMRRDSSNLTRHDHFGVGFDTLYDGRNGFQFFVTAAGGMRDGFVTGERYSADWNGVWDARTTRFDEGWIVEMRIPFKTLRYAAGREQTWHIQFRRHVTSKSEWTNLTALNPNWRVSGWNRFYAGATLVGLEAPPPSTNLEFKPYAIARMTTDRVSNPTFENKVDENVGFDVKYGLTPSLTADFSYNTDFAQVEADEAQVNLTRFKLSFPEKREFFLEGQGLFQFGGGGGGDLRSSMAPQIFYSRQIGLSNKREVPVIAGGRLNGKIGPWSIGALNISTGEDVAANAQQTNFTVLRLRRDILRRSNLGVLYTRRSLSTVANGANDVSGIDANFAFHTNVYLSGYLAQSRTNGLNGNDLSYRSQFNYTHDRYGLAFDHLVVEKNFNPEIGLLRRQNFKRNFARARFSPRTSNNSLVRQWTYESSIDYITDNNNVLESRDVTGEFKIDFHNSDAFSVEYHRLYELLITSFKISNNVRIAPGGYDFNNMIVSYTAGSQYRLSGTTTLETGSFYDGDKKTAKFRGRLEITPQLGLEPTISLNWIDLPAGSFTNTVVGARSVFTMTPRMFVAALVQHSSSNDSISTNLRFRWEYHPGSELFIVYSEGRSTFPPRGTELENRGLVIKVNRLFRF
jgi:hypothetical protein